ncbi:hypothetical protein AX16_002979 [Volvariella volvacea WC 439]|nr:hypothetical protein AX16_002979 [Volvariella volvacea WC 439]
MLEAVTRFKLVFFVPRNQTREVLRKIFYQNPQTLGRIGNYEQCAFVTPGTGQFKPCSGANPTIGEAGRLEYVEEDKVELVVNDEGENKALKEAIRSLKGAHPYEEVAYEVYKMEPF